MKACTLKKETKEQAGLIVIFKSKYEEINVKFAGITKLLQKLEHQGNSYLIVHLDSENCRRRLNI